MILFLLIGCKESVYPEKVEGSPSSNVNTLNNPDLNVMNGDIENYFYAFDKGIEAHYQYFNDNITRGNNTINQPVTFNPYIDTLNFRTFPNYTVTNEIEGQIETNTFSHMLTLTSDIQDSCSTLYPLDEMDPDEWCDKMLVEYEGNCDAYKKPDGSIEVAFDYQLAATGTGAQLVDTTSNVAVFNNQIADKSQRFETTWTNVKSLKWDKTLNRYDIVLEDTTRIMTAFLCAGTCDPTKFNDTLLVCENDLGLTACYDSTYVIDTTFTDYFDSLIYIGIIDTSRYPALFPLAEAEGVCSCDDGTHVHQFNNNKRGCTEDAVCVAGEPVWIPGDAILIDRTEWERYDSTFQSEAKPYQLDTTFTYERILIPQDSPMYRKNGDCNQDDKWDPAEPYYDYGEDWCPDSLETGEGNCTVVDEDIDGDLYNEKPCHCLIDWTDNEPDPDIVNSDWAENNDFDPNGDNWRDCGWDNKCPGDAGYEYPDFNGTEGNNIADKYERMDENGQYDVDKKHNTGEYFDDRLNETIEGTEFCDKGDDGICDIDDPFEDRNCNGIWDGQLFPNKGNGIWDDDELFSKREACADPFYDNEEDCVYAGSTWGPVGDDPTKWEEGADDHLYIITNRLETFIVDYTNPQDPQPLPSSLDTETCAKLYYEADQYCNFIEKKVINKMLSKKFHDKHLVTTTYTNKIIELPDPVLLPNTIENYYITKTTWFQDINQTFPQGVTVETPNYGNNYGYDYHLFKNGENGYDKIKMVHPAYFNYYGYNFDFEDIEVGSWRTELLEDDIYLYTYGGQLRSGEYVSTNRTIETDVANYYIEELYEVAFDSSVTVPFKRVKYDTFLNTQTGFIDTMCLVTPKVSWLIKANTYNPAVGQNLDWVKEDYMNRCPPADTILQNTYKITRTKIITMIGSGLEFGLRNTFWLGSEGQNDPLGIVKDQLEIRWSEPYWQEYGSGWFIISRLELSSLHASDSDSESSSLLRIFDPMKRLSLDRLDDEEIFENDPYVITSSYGIHRLRPPNEK